MEEVTQEILGPDTLCVLVKDRVVYGMSVQELAPKIAESATDLFLDTGSILVLYGLKKVGGVESAEVTPYTADLACVLTREPENEWGDGFRLAPTLPRGSRSGFSNGRGCCPGERSLNGVDRFRLPGTGMRSHAGAWERAGHDARFHRTTGNSSHRVV